MMVDLNLGWKDGYVEVKGRVVSTNDHLHLKIRRLESFSPNVLVCSVMLVKTVHNMKFLRRKYVGKYRVDAVTHGILLSQGALNPAVAVGGLGGEEGPLPARRFLHDVHVHLLAGEGGHDDDDGDDDDDDDDYLERAAMSNGP